jgi:hypothetical protein
MIMPRNCRDLYNPKPMSVLSIIFGVVAFFVAIYSQYMNQQAILNSDSDSNFTPNNPTALCKTAIIYDNHLDSASAKFVYNLLDKFKTHNYGTFLFEYPMNTTLEQKVNYLDSTIERYKKEITKGNFKLDHIWGPMSVPKWYKEMVIDQFEATTSLLKKIKELGLRYIAVDMDGNSLKELGEGGAHNLVGIEKRNTFMANSIIKACETYKDDQVLIVGAMHGGIARILKELGYK